MNNGYVKHIARELATAKSHKEKLNYLLEQTGPRWRVWRREWRRRPLVQFKDGLTKQLVLSTLGQYQETNVWPEAAPFDLGLIEFSRHKCLEGEESVFGAILQRWQRKEDAAFLCCKENILGESDFWFPGKIFHWVTSLT